MTKVSSVFFEGLMNKDVAPSVMREGYTRHVENIRFFTNNGADGTGKSSKGSSVVSDETNGDDQFKCIGGYFDKNNDRIFYLLGHTDSNISKILEYNIKNETTEVVADDTTGVLKFNKEGYVTGINEIDGLLFISEWGNNPRRLNIERAKTYGQNGFTEDDIAVIVKPPINKPVISLENTDTDSQQENNIVEKFIYFAYRLSLIHI